ncbi:hypothetical protein QIH01_23255 [Brevibacillus brevis]|nr:hypothetical protein QIH01_23255 [Brevibacillus brevis]
MQKTSAGRNPGRKSEDQSYHDRILTILVNDLVSQGYTVKADHIGWPNGSPGEINGYIPDVIATNGSSTFIFEVEDCTSYKSSHTKDQLTAFSKSAATFVVIPNVCLNNEGNRYNPSPDMRQTLDSWGLTSVRIATCDPDTRAVSYY